MAYMNPSNNLVGKEKYLKGLENHKNNLDAKGSNQTLVLSEENKIL